MAELNIINKLPSGVKLKDIKNGDIFYYPSKYESLQGYYIKTNKRPQLFDTNNKRLEGNFIGCTRFSDGKVLAINENTEIFNDFNANINIDYNII